MSRCFVSRGRRGTWWHSDVFCNVSKVVLCGKRNTFATFSDDALQFSWQAQNFGRVHRHFAWQAQHFRACCLRIALAGLRQVATRCRFRGTRGILWDVLKINGSLAQNSDFEVANLEVPKKTRRKTSILRPQSVKIGGSLARNARFDASTCLVSSLWFSCGLAVSMGEAAQAFLFDFFPTVKIGRSLARNARFSAPTCLVSSLWFCGFAVSMGEAAKPLLFGGFQAGCSVVLRGRRGTLWHSNLFDNVSKDVERKCQNWRKSRTKCSFCCAHVSRLESLVFLWPRCVYGGSYKISPFQRFSSRSSFRFAWQTWHFVTFQPVLYRVESSLCGWRNKTIHATLYTLHFTFHTLHSTFYTPHSTLLTLHSTLRTLHSTLSTPHSTLYTLPSTLHTPQFTL